MEITRRDAVLKLLFGAGMIGLRSLATGIPASILLNPRRALAGDAGEEEGGVVKPPGPTGAQFVIFASSGSGDPVNCNAPGTYDDPNIGHPSDPSMARAPIGFGGSSVNGAQIWSTLPPSVLARTCFFHHGTYTVIHPDEVKVLAMMGAVASGEMLPSFLSRELAPTLGTVRSQPITLSGNANEAIYYQGAPQPLLTPTTLASVLSAPKNGLGTANLVALRDQGLNSLNALVKSSGTTAQKSFIDKYATSVTQLRTLQASLLSSLSAIKDNSQDSQIQAALILFQMKVTPVVVVHVAFGGDNHGDPNLAGEVAGHQTGVASIATMMQELTAANLQDQVTFAMMNVFGRTMIASKNTNGRGHNDTHHVSVLIGPKIKGGVIGGVAQPKAGAGYAALPIVSATGAGSTSGDVPFNATFGAMGQTLATAVGLSPATIAANVLAGTVIEAALA
jgi:hypothetical protein